MNSPEMNLNVILIGKVESGLSYASVFDVVTSDTRLNALFPQIYLVQEMSLTGDPTYTLTPELPEGYRSLRQKTQKTIPFPCDEWTNLSDLLIKNHGPQEITPLGCDNHTKIKTYQDGAVGIRAYLQQDLLDKMTKQIDQQLKLDLADQREKAGVEPSARLVSTAQPRLLSDINRTSTGILPTNFDEAKMDKIRRNLQSYYIGNSYYRRRSAVYRRASLPYSSQIIGDYPAHEAEDENPCKKIKLRTGSCHMPGRKNSEMFFNKVSDWMDEEARLRHLKQCDTELDSEKKKPTWFEIELNRLKSQLVDYDLSRGWISARPFSDEEIRYYEGSKIPAHREMDYEVIKNDMNFPNYPDLSKPHTEETLEMVDPQTGQIVMVEKRTVTKQETNWESSPTQSNEIDDDYDFFAPMHQPVEKSEAEKPTTETDDRFCQNADNLQKGIDDWFDEMSKK